MFSNLLKFLVPPSSPLYYPSPEHHVTTRLFLDQYPARTCIGKESVPGYAIQDDNKSISRHRYISIVTERTRLVTRSCSATRLHYVDQHKAAACGGSNSFGSVHEAVMIIYPAKRNSHSSIGSSCQCVSIDQRVLQTQHTRKHSIIRKWRCLLSDLRTQHVRMGRTGSREGYGGFEHVSGLHIIGWNQCDTITANSKWLCHSFHQQKRAGDVVGRLGCI